MIFLFVWTTLHSDCFTDDVNGQGSQEFTIFISQDSHCVPTNSQEYVDVAQKDGESDVGDSVLDTVFEESDMDEDKQRNLRKQREVGKRRNVG